TAGVVTALAGMTWLSQISSGTPYLTGIALPMAILGVGAGAAFTPLTSSGVAGVSPEDAGAASGLVNVTHQVGGSLGLGVLVTVSAQAHDLASSISASLTAGAVMLALALAVVVVVLLRPERSGAAAPVAGLFLGALNITTRHGLARVADVEAGSAVMTAIAFVLVAVAAVATGSSLDARQLWPFLLIGVFVPGLSNLLVVRAVQAAGASRAGVLFGMSPLFSSLIAVFAFGEALRWPLVAGTLLVVGGGVS